LLEPSRKKDAQHTGRQVRPVELCIGDYLEIKEANFSRAAGPP
jgi:hypothetical protein